MDSQGRKVIVCDNGTGVSKETVQTGSQLDITFAVYFSLLNVDMPAVIFLLIYFLPWLADLLSEPLIKSET